MIAAWFFVITLCCPAQATHTIRWESPTQDACQTMRRIIAKEVRGLTVRATVGECKEKRDPA